MSTISRKVKITFPLFIVSCLLFELKIKKVTASIFKSTSKTETDTTFFKTVSVKHVTTNKYVQELGFLIIRYSNRSGNVTSPFLIMKHGLMWRDFNEYKVTFLS